MVHVAHVEAGAFAGQAAGTERGQPALVRKLGERVGLVHKLRQLRAAEEFAHRRHDRADVYQRRRRGRRRVYLRGHALFDDALHSQQADAHLILYQLADCADAPVAQVVDVVRRNLAVVDANHLLQQRDDVVRFQRADGVAFVPLQAAVELVASHAP